MIDVNLDSGKSVKVNAFVCAATYGSFLEGGPSYHWNKRLIDQMLYPSEWRHGLSEERIFTWLNLENRK